MIVLWRITERCNLACGFCAYDRRLKRERRDAQAQTVLRLGALLAQYQQHTGERVLLSWLGGEPMLWRPIFDVSRELRQRHGLQISATTNGRGLQASATVEAVLASFTELTVSVDGLSEFHDGMRGSVGAWRRLRDGTARLAERRAECGALLKLRANVVLMRDNLGELVDLCNGLVQWGVDETTFNALGGRDRPEFFPQHSLRPQDIAILNELLLGLRPALAARGVALCGSQSYLQRIHASVNGIRIAPADCAPGERFLFIDEAGLVSPCSFTSGDYGIDIDSLRTVSDLLDLPAAFRRARTAARATACEDCQSTQLFARFEPHSA